jgi:excisionase family DNA binding protein
MVPKTFSTSEAAKQIGVSRQTLQTWLAAGKINGPEPSEVGGVTVRLWTSTDIARAKKFKPRTRVAQK